MKKDTSFLYDLGDFFDGKYNSRLIICVHNGDDHCVVSKAVSKFIQIQETFGIDRKVSNVVSELLKVFAEIEDCWVLNARGYYVTFLRKTFQSALDGGIIAQIRKLPPSSRRLPSTLSSGRRIS